MARVRIFHNINRDAGFGLNAVFTKQGKTYAETPEECHELVLVFEYNTVTGSDERTESILNYAFETFNVGTNDLAQKYRGRKLRSLSVGDVVMIDGHAYSCDSVGWTPRGPDDLRVLPADEAERLVRERFDFGPAEELAITVPWSEESRS